jgi:uncharacterized protein YdeI (YjbR/CyaY-like superfamily)
VKPVFFATPSAFRAWLGKHHGDTSELLVGFHKVGSGTPGITWPQAVDEALCFGWIDGVRRRIDEARYSIRFSPRKVGSTWSAINIRRVAALQAEGRMQPAGLEAHAARSAGKSRTYSYEQAKATELAPELARRFRASGKAWTFFHEQAPSYQRKCIHWVATAKAAATQQRRLDALIENCARGQKV